MSDPGGPPAVEPALPPDPAGEADPTVPRSGPVVAIVAAKDSAATVEATVAAILGLGKVDEVVVVDDGSTDRTAEAGRRAGAWVLRLPANRGKGGAVAAGVSLASSARAYLLVDADVGGTASATGPLLDAVLAGEADMAVGVLPSADGRGGFGLVRDAAAAGIRRATGHPAKAPLSGQRAVRGDLLRQLVLAPRFGLEVGLTIDARRAGARVVELPVEMDHRHTGRSPAGFAHRARQGADVLRALWPRLTSVRARLALLACGLLVTLLAALWSAGRWEARSVPVTAPAERVLMVGLPGLRWDEVGTGRMPNLDRMMAGGAVSAVTVRTLSKEPSTAEAYATLGAGGRVEAGRAALAATGAGAQGVKVTASGDVRREAGSNVASRPGALGDALHAAGLRTAVVGNADLASGLVYLGPLNGTRRPAAVALMDSSGRVDAGSVEAEDLLMADPRAPFGRRADPERVLARTREALAGAAVVLVDPGDLDRAAALSDLAPQAFATRARAETLAHTDALLGRLVAEAPPGTLVLVLSVVPPADEWRLAPMVAGGAGVVGGYLHSPSTRRLGLVTLTDVAPTVLASLGLDVPSDMIGHPLRYHAGPADPDRLVRLDRDIAYRERIYLGVALGFIVFQALVYGLLALALSRPRMAFRGKGLLRTAALAIAAFPLATLLFRGLAPFAPDVGPAGVIFLVAADALVVALVSRARHPLTSLAWIFGATAWLLVADVATGGRLQLGGILGYSPQSAGRFFGMGNTAFAVLAACSLLAVAIHVERAPRRREALAAAAAFLALVAIVDGAPSLGDDVGGILTLVPVFGLSLVAMAGRRITWRLVAGAAALTVVVLGLAIAVDLMRPPEARTHLGRLASDTWKDGGGELWTTISRKVAVNVRLLHRTPWAWAVPVIAGFLVHLLVVRRRWADLVPPGSALRVGVLGALAAGVLGFAVNDSGVVVTALTLVEVGPLLAILALAGNQGRPVLLEPTADAPTRSSVAAPGPAASSAPSAPSAPSG